MQTFLLMVGAAQQNSEIWDVLFSLIAGKTMLTLERRRTVALSTSSRQCTTDLATAILLDSFCLSCFWGGQLITCSVRGTF